MAFNHQVTLKNVWKLCFSPKLHSAYMIGHVYIRLACWKIEQLYGGLPEDDALCNKNALE